MSDDSSQPSDVESGEIQFTVLKRGERDSLGPLTQGDIMTLMNEGTITVNDYVFYDGIGEWKPIHEVFEVQEQISHFVDDGQDTQRVGIAFREVSNVVGGTESIYYIAVQAKAGLLSKTKDCVIITDQHLYVMSETRKGYELEAYPWNTVMNTLMRDEGKGLGTFSVLLGADRRLDIAQLPLAQVHRLFQLSQEMKKGVAL